MLNEMRRLEREMDSMVNQIFRNFIYDKPYSIITIQQEKEKHNFSTRHWQEVKQDDGIVLVYDVHGINPSDIKVTKTIEDENAYITVTGKTKNELLNCEMEINARWAIPYRQYKKITKKIENGFLYVFIKQERIEEEIEEI